MKQSRLRKFTGAVVKYTLLIILAVFMVYPLLWLIASSFRPNMEIFTSVGLFVKNPIWNSYIEGWKSVGDITYTTYFTNTFKMVIPTVFFTIVSSFITAYGFARFDFKGKKIFFSLMIGCLLLPQEVLIVPKYLIYNRFGWLNTYLPFIVPAIFATYSFFIFLLVQYIRGIPKELDQSAKIDGASSFTIMTRVILPLCKPALFSVTIFQFVWRWNDFFNPLIFINSVIKYPVSLGLRLNIEVGETIAWNQTIAMAVLTMLPPTLVYFFAQKYFVEGVATTGLKG
jgi:oligogalacturonide transport system permease protein